MLKRLIFPLLVFAAPLALAATSPFIWQGTNAKDLTSGGVVTPMLSLPEGGTGSDQARIQAPASLAATYTLTLPTTDGNANQVLSTDGSGVLSWVNAALVPSAGAVYSDGSALQSETSLAVARGGTGAATLTSHGVLLGNGTSAVSATAEGATNTVLHGNTGAAPTYSGVVSADITDGTIVNADVNASAAIAVSKLAAVTASKALVSDGSGFVSASSVTTTELGLLSGVTGTLCTTAASQSLTNKKLGSLTTNGPIYTSGGDGTLNSEAQLDRTRGGTGVSSTATFPTSSTNDADFVMKGNVAQTISGTKTFSGQLIGKGTATNDSAAAGYIGELIESSKTRANRSSATTNSAVNVTGAAMSLTAGDWDVEGTYCILTAASTSVTELIAGISLTSATIPSITVIVVPSGNEVQFIRDMPASVINGDVCLTVPATRVSVGSTTSVYFVGRATFTVSTAEYYGYARARRVR